MISYLRGEGITFGDVISNVSAGDTLKEYRFKVFTSLTRCRHRVVMRQAETKLRTTGRQKGLAKQPVKLSRSTGEGTVTTGHLCRGQSCSVSRVYEVLRVKDGTALCECLHCRGMELVGEEGG